ncbi:Rid family detoxifying hydrolase [Phytohabitans sp. ZYX-F-186]|uniref:Rid family detoxifying hydrolase n=1 Tax=Phytohabitans maris TaxID=3071409 RepID=A0ABU0ZTJ7_9ACTN|nr:Rid family detoxifying hydrolase [Phytohabitans sp. ZYX-F-186]MDQ7910116.1 Rid family detoxifying hydrolase [Phytohabitans sp. ZYX-F-186]
MTERYRREAVQTTDAPTPTGPFNQAIRIGPLIFTAGQAGRDRDTGTMGDLAEQTEWALRNLDGILRAAGSTLTQAVKLTIYLRDDQDTAALNEVYRHWFSDPLPARSLVQVSRLKGPEMLVEIEAVAVTT